MLSIVRIVFVSAGCGHDVGDEPDIAGAVLPGGDGDSSAGQAYCQPWPKIRSRSRRSSSGSEYQLHGSVAWADPVGEEGTTDEAIAWEADV